MIFKVIRLATEQVCIFASMEKEYWYLREGDFRPEPIESICNSWHRSRRNIVEFLSQNGNIFTSRKDAEEASRVVRAALISHQELRGHLAEIRIDVDIPLYDEG